MSFQALDPDKLGISEPERGGAVPAVEQNPYVSRSTSAPFAVCTEAAWWKATTSYSDLAWT